MTDNTNSAALDERALFEAWNVSLGQESFGIRSVPNLPPAAWAAWQARAAIDKGARQAAPEAPDLSNAEFLSKRLARVAKLAGVSMPSGTHEQIAEVAGTILGSIAYSLERATPAATTVSASIDTPEFRALLDKYDDEASYGSLKNGRAALIAHIDGRTAGTAWQPIATVPMDGSEVLLYLPAPSIATKETP